MKKLAMAMVLGVSLFALVARAETPEEEAKRRSVPLAQVQAERALAAEKVKGNTLDKKLATLQKELTALEGSGTPAATTASTGARPSTGTAATSKPASAIHDTFRSLVIWMATLGIAAGGHERQEAATRCACRRSRRRI